MCSMKCLLYHLLQRQHQHCIQLLTLMELNLHATLALPYWAEFSIYNEGLPPIYICSKVQIDKRQIAN